MNYTLKLRCNNCMSIFYESLISNPEKCPVCGAIGTLMDVPEFEFPQYYKDSPKEN